MACTRLLSLHRKRLAVFGIIVAVILLVVPYLQHFIGRPIRTLRGARTLSVANIWSLNGDLYENLFDNLSMFTYDEEKYKTSRNAYDLPRFRFIPELKSPCFVSRSVDTHRQLVSRSADSHRQLVCLPYVFLAGFEKCGTTDLYHAILGHETVLKPAQKEPQWWGKNQYKGVPFGGYLRNFRSASDTMWRDYVTRRRGDWHGDLVTIDASASTILHQYVWRRHYVDMMTSQAVVINRRLSTPHQIKQILPLAKFLVILRDPVERLYSSYHFYPLLPKHVRSRANATQQMALKSPQDFHVRCERAIDWLESCMRRYGHEHRRCVYYSAGETTHDVFLSKLQVGLYAPILEDWFKVFHKRQFKNVKLEEFSVDKRRVMNGIFQFLGLSFDNTTVLNVNSTSRVSQDGSHSHVIHNQNRSPSRKQPMLQKTREMLANFYRPYNVRLSALLKDTSFLAYNVKKLKL